MALYIIVMDIPVIALIGLLLIGFLIGMAILILRERAKAKNKEYSELRPATDSNKEIEEGKDKETKKYCRSRCWCCLNCWDCQQRRPPGFDPFPKKEKRKYTISQQEREKRRQRMKRRWEMGREEMIRKIRAGLWRWLLEIEDDCDCWCCKICLRCQTAQESKNKGTQEAAQCGQDTPKTQIKSPEEQSKPSRKKTDSPKKGTKPPEGQTRPPRKKIKSVKGRNKPPQKRLKASDLSKRTSKTSPRTPKARKNRSFFARILEVIKKSGEVISKIFEKLKNLIGLGKQKIGRQVRKGQKVSKNRPLFIRIFMVVKEWIGTFSRFIKNLPRQIDPSKQKGTQHNRSPPK